MDTDPALHSFVETAVKYEGYIERQRRDIDNVRSLEKQRIPAEFSFETLTGLSTEARQKLAQKRPETVGHASRIAGVRAADLSILAVHLKRFSCSNDKSTS